MQAIVARIPVPSFFRRLVAAVAIVTAAGCGAEPPSNGDVSGEERLAPSTETCRLERSRLQEATGTASGGGAYDAVLSVSTSGCGASFVTSGPSSLDAHRLVRIGSVTKTYVATVTMRLAAEGRIDLDQRLDAYLPDAPPAAAGVTVRQLLQHTSGLYNYTASIAFWNALAADPLRRRTPGELIELAMAQPPHFAPGTAWRYSNTNYILVGLMLEKVVGKPIAAQIREQILAPNGLNETFFDGEEPVVGELAPGTFVNLPGLPTLWKDGADVTHAYTPTWAWAAGALVASPDDVRRFIALLAGGTLLPPAAFTEMTKGVETPQPGLRYGLGVMLTDASLSAGAGPGIGHGGDIMGYHTMTFHFPEARVTMAGAVTSDRGSGNAVLAGALGALFGEADPARASRRVDVEGGLTTSSMP